jgi:hypothetical protein
MQRLLGSIFMLAFLLCCLACASVDTPPEPEAPPSIPEPPGGWKVIQPADAAGLGNFENSAKLVIDGKFVRNQTVWNAAQCVWWNGVNSHVVVDLGKPCSVVGVVIQLSSNNDYQIQYSLDGHSYKVLCQIGRGDFKLRSGMDTVSSLPNRADTVPGIVMKHPVEARYLQIRALGGVNEQYSVSEIEVFGTCGKAPGS